MFTLRLPPPNVSHKYVITTFDHAISLSISVHTQLKPTDLSLLFLQFSQSFSFLLVITANFWWLPLDGHTVVFAVLSSKCHSLQISFTPSVLQYNSCQYTSLSTNKIATTHRLTVKFVTKCYTHVISEESELSEKCIKGNDLNSDKHCHIHRWHLQEATTSHTKDDTPP